MPSTGFSAGAQASASYLAYGAETVWGTAAVDLTALRFTSESLVGSKTRDRPNEIDGQRSVSHAITTAEGAAGAINFAKSFGTYDAFIEALVGGVWGTVIPNVNILVDGSTFTSFTIEKKVQAAQFFRYTGMYPTGMNLQISNGAFVGGSFNFVGKSEAKAAAALDATVTAAPAGRVINASAGVISILLGGATIGKAVSMNFNIQNQGAGEQRAVGSTSAAGINPGILMATADCELYFADYSLYDRFIAESTAELAVRIQDTAGKGYTIKLLAPLVDAPAPGIQAKDRPVMQRVQLMGNPSPTAGANLGKTIEITRDAP